MKYSSSLNLTQFKRIAHLFPRKAKTGRPREHRLFDIVNGILYVLINGCKWMDLPHDFPTWKTVYHYFRKWSVSGLWKRIHDYLVTKTRKFHGRKTEPTLLIIDSQSVKSSNQSCSKGFDGNKKVKGRKKHVLVDVLGLLHGLHLSEANKHDRPEGLKLLESLSEGCQQVVKLIADLGYDSANFMEQVKSLKGWIVEISEKLTETVKTGFKVEPFRWIVERTFAWFNQARRLVRDYEVKIEHSISLHHLFMSRLMLRRIC